MEDQVQTPVYSKRPMWQWVAVYAVIGAVVYGAVYYFFLAKKPGSTYTTAPAPAVVQQGKVGPTANPTTVEKQRKGEEVTIFLIPSGFVPADMTVRAGTHVIWANQSGVMGNVSSAPHPTHTDYPALNLGDFGPGEPVSLTFSTPGTYKYHNHLNPSQTGAITVVQ